MLGHRECCCDSGYWETHQVHPCAISPWVAWQCELLLPRVCLTGDNLGCLWVKSLCLAKYLSSYLCIASIVRDEQVRCTIYRKVPFQFGYDGWWGQTSEQVGFEPAGIRIHKNLIMFAMPIKNVCSHCGPWQIWNRVELEGLLPLMRLCAIAHCTWAILL